MTASPRALFFAAAAALFLALPVASPAAAKDSITIDLVNEPATLDPHLQWNPDSYGGTKSLRWQPTSNESLFLNRMAWED